MFESKARPVKLLSAHVFPHECASTDWIVKQCIRDVERADSYNAIVIRSDGEPAILDVLNQLANGRNDNTVLGPSPLTKLKLSVVLKVVLNAWRR